MPNHVTNHLFIKGESERVKEVFSFIKGPEEDRYMDFNKITPMPAWVFGSSPDVIGIGYDDIQKYGEENTALGWSREHWGTKWNAYFLQLIECEEDGSGVSFQTAWSSPIELIKKLGFIFPDITFTLRYADEDFGHNTGRIVFKDTETIESYIPTGGTKEAYELAATIDPDRMEYYEWNEKKGKYEHKEDDDE